MCGIVGYVGASNKTKLVLAGLKALEYRGYDSCGVSLFDMDKNDFQTYKSLKRIASLEEIVQNKSNLLIAHTRWATHGGVNITNSHPISSRSSRFIMVHNGIIENYLSIKETILKDYKFISQTDTEVIANLIEYYSYNYELEEALQKTFETLEGSFACIILDTTDTSRLWFMKNRSPLLIGDNDGYYVTSDILAFPDNTSKYYRLNDGDLGYVTKDEAVIIDKCMFKFNPNFKVLEKSNYSTDLLGHKHHMEKEIYEQPSIVSNAIERFFNENKIKLYDALYLALAKASKIYLVASGTSYHACLVGTYLFNKISYLESYSFIASEFNTSNLVLDKNSIFIVISQSGETADLITALTDIKSLGIKTIAITNVVTSTIAYMADYVIDMKAGAEIAVASTKAYTASCLILSILAVSLKEAAYDLKHDIKTSLISMQDAFDKVDIIKELSVEISKCKDLFYLGKGLDYILACEASLKLKEISYIHSEAFAAGELKHGTIALIEKGTIAIAIITQKNTSRLIRGNIAEVESRGGKVITIVSRSLATSRDDIILDDCPDYLSFLSVAVIIQLFAYFVAVEKGNDVDKPRNLAKSVTVE